LTYLDVARDEMSTTQSRVFEETFLSASEDNVYRVTDRAYSDARVSLYLGLFGYWFVIPLLVLSVGWGLDGTVGMFELLVVALFIVLGVFAIVGIRSWRKNTTLKVTAKEFIYQTAGLTIRSPWSNVERIEERDEARLVLRHRAAVKMSVWIRLQRFTTSAYWNVDRWVPLTPFGWSKSSTLYDRLQEVAPHLFSGANQAEQR
jgi:hypothetical protein